MTAMAQRVSRGKAAQIAARAAAAEIAEALAADTDWQSRAACRDVPLSTSVAMVSASSLADGELLAWPCRACPVAYDCLTMGLQSRASGIWGGFVLNDGREVTE